MTGTVRSLVMEPTAVDKLMDGRAPARRILDDVARAVARIRGATGTAPMLATILVGRDPASEAYVRTKRRRCREIGIESRTIEFPEDSTTAAVVEAVRRLAEEEGVHAILVQHPVPGAIDRRAVFEAVPPAKDVDGVSSAALGRVLLGMNAMVPCTPAGIMRLLAEYGVALSGAGAVVIGRSPIIGRPMASLLINAHATVTLCHSRTRDLPSIVRGADVLIAAVGRPRFVRGEWIKPGAVVVDAGYNEGAIGDVDFDSAVERAGKITPVPGGVGPMTIAMLLKQTTEAAAAQLKVALSD
jgi:methylenetetrahydrofolate dehydrogenase (NADP+)/methenyltetrahydrofolate cyclohydrolase